MLSRKRFLELLATAGLATLLPNIRLEHKMAEFSTLLTKIALNQKLTPSELDDLARYGTETQLRNASAGNNIGPDGKPLFGPIRAQTAFFEISPFFPAWFGELSNQAAPQTIPDTISTTITTGWAQSVVTPLSCVRLYDAVNGRFDFSTDINFTRNSILRISWYMLFNDGLSARRDVGFAIKKKSDDSLLMFGSLGYSLEEHILSGNYYIQFFRLLDGLGVVPSECYLTVYVAQFSGGDSDIYPSIFFEKVA